MVGVGASVQPHAARVEEQCLALNCRQDLPFESMLKAVNLKATVITAIASGVVETLAAAVATGKLPCPPLADSKG